MRIKIKKIFIILFLISFKIIAQNTYSIEVTYKTSLNFDYSETNFSKLNFNNSKSYYVENIKGESKKEYQINNGEKIIEYENNFNTIINTNLKSNTILSKVKLGEELFLVKENLTSIKWKINEKSTDTI
jgi:hypothetical protein